MEVRTSIPRAPDCLEPADLDPPKKTFEKPNYSIFFYPLPLASHIERFVMGNNVREIREKKPETPIRG